MTYNSEDAIARCLSALSHWRERLSVVVVDNGSTDGTLEVVAGAQLPVKVIEAADNPGFGSSVNLGVRTLVTSEVLLVNPDVELSKIDYDGLDRLVAERRVGLRAIEDPGGHAGPYREHSWWSDAVGAMIQMPPARKPIKDSPDPETAGWISGWGMLVRRSEFLDLGGFDERFFMYYEDRDLSRRYRHAGLPLVRERAIAGTHAGAGSSPDSPLGVRTAWSLLGLAEYWRKASPPIPPAANLAVVLAGMVVARQALGIIAAAPGAHPRWARQRCQVSDTLREVLTYDPHAAINRGRYPDASPALLRIQKFVRRLRGN